LVLLAALDDGKLAELNRAAGELLGARFDVDRWTMATAAGLGTVDEDGFRFRHPLIRSAVYQAATGHAGPEVADLMRAPFSYGDADALRARWPSGPASAGYGSTSTPAPSASHPRPSCCVASSRPRRPST
jgi:hypothetical protein